MSHEVLLSSLADTEVLGQRLAKSLFPGAVIALVGPLGAGKTTLTRAIAIALGVEPRLIASPTFALVHEYPGRLSVYHFDVYRLANIDEFLGLGADEYLHGDGVCLVEWADRVIVAMPADHLRIELIPHGDIRRAILTASGPRHVAIIDSLSVVDSLGTEP